jgi:hypothetical protein
VSIIERLTQRDFAVMAVPPVHFFKKSGYEAENFNQTVKRTFATESTQ